MKVITAFFMSLALVSTAFAGDDTLPQVDNAWFKHGQDTVLEKVAQTPNTNSAKNVILMIADGNGVGSNYAIRLFRGQSTGGYGDEHVLPYEMMPHVALVKTYNVNAQTPDSAGTATALHAGIKTKAGVIGVDETLIRGDCSGVETSSVKSIAEILAADGKSVGVVSTARITHATPASVYAHAADRNFEDDSDLPQGCGVKDIASQLIDAMKSGTIDFAMGGGRRHFLSKSMRDEEGYKGRRHDGKNLIDAVRAMGIQYAWNDTTAARLRMDGSPILALFEPSHMQYEYDRTGEPSLAKMTEMAIKALRGNDKGFFLSVEAGRVDHAHHDGNLYRAVTDGVAFAEAVATAMDMTSDTDTLLIVTADHEHAIAFNGYCGRGSAITGLCHKIDGAGVRHLKELEHAEDGKPFTVAGYLNGAGSILQENTDYTGARPSVIRKDVVDPDYKQQALIPRSSETHSGEDVAVYARGPWAHLLNGTIEQNVIFHVMYHAAKSP